MKTHSWRIEVLSAGLLLVGQEAFAQSLEKACSSIITSGLREYSVNTESDSYLQTVFDRHCEKSGEAKKSSSGFGLDLGIGEFSLGLDDDSADSSRRVANFCKSYAKVERQNRSVDKREEKIVREAYRSFDACMVMAASGVIVRHEVRSFGDVDFFISTNYNGKVSIKGIQTPPNVKCMGHRPDADPGKPAVAQEFNINTALVLHPTQSFNMACVRSPRAGAGGDAEGTPYDESVITVLTDIRPEGNYSAYLPADVRIPETRASVLVAQLASLDERNKVLAAELDAARKALLSGTTVVGAINGNRDQELNVFVPFKDADGKNVEFAAAPIVVATVERAKAQAGVYWTVNITGVTTKGFHARIFSVERMAEPNYGWSGAAALQWIAYSR